MNNNPTLESTARPKLDCIAYLLAGGKSSRFGSDKARAIVEAQPLINLLATQIAPCADEVIVVADQPNKYQDLGCTNLVDVYPSIGPMGGLITALEHHRSDNKNSQRWLLLTSCDLLRFELDWINAWQQALSRSFTELGREIGPTPLAVIFFDDHLHPFPALYHPDIEPEVRRAISSQQHSIVKLLGMLGERVLKVKLPTSAPIRSANTPEELQSHLSAIQNRQAT